MQPARGRVPVRLILVIFKRLSAADRLQTVIGDRRRRAAGFLLRRIGQLVNDCFFLLGVVILSLACQRIGGRRVTEYRLAGLGA